MSTAAKKIRRKDLRQPDEFFTLTGQALDWIEENRRTLIIASGAVVALFALGAAIRWYVDSREARAARDFYAAEQLYRRDQWDIARDSFNALATGFPRTAYGKLARLYVGHCALRGDHPGEAVTAFRGFLDAGPP